MKIVSSEHLVTHDPTKGLEFNRTRHIIWFIQDVLRFLSIAYGAVFILFFGFILFGNTSIASGFPILLGFAQTAIEFFLSSLIAGQILKILREPKRATAYYFQNASDKTFVISELFAFMFVIVLLLTASSALLIGTKAGIDFGITSFSFASLSPLWQLLTTNEPLSLSTPLIVLSVPALAMSVLSLCTSYIFAHIKTD